MKNRLIANFRAYIIKHADRDDLRAFNFALKRHKFLAFYSYIENELDGTCFLYIDFSNNGFEGKPAGNYEARDMNIKNDMTELYVYSECAQHFPNERIVVPTSDIEPFYIEPVSWDLILGAPKLKEGDWYNLSYVVFDYMKLDNEPWESEVQCVTYLTEQTDITLDVVYEVDDIVDRHVSTTTLVKYCGSTVGIISSKGRRGSPVITAYAFDIPKFHWLLDKIILEADLDKFREPDKIVALDMSKDCDAYFGVPGLTNTQQGILR